MLIDHFDEELNTSPAWGTARARRLRDWSARHPFIVDGALASAISALLLFTEAIDAGEVGAKLDWVDIAVCAVAGILIALRRYAPVPVFVVALAAALWSLIPDDDQVVLRVAAVLALYTVASTRPRRVAWLAGAVSAAALFAMAVATNSGPWFASDNLQQIAWMGAALAAGEAVRSRRAYAIARDERAQAIRERIEQEREEETLRAVIEERLRIARELHDVVAHHIAVVNVQAGVAQHLLRSNPDGAGEALGHVRARTKNVLDDLAGILNTMRETGDPLAVTDPLPSLDRLPSLVEEFSASGLYVDFTIEGDLAGIGDAVPKKPPRLVTTRRHRPRRTAPDCAEPRPFPAPTASRRLG